MTDGALSELDRAVIEQRCARLVNQFAVLNDARQFDALAALFTPQGSFARPTDPDRPTIGRAAIQAQLESRPPRVTRHVVANIVITVESRERARGVSYVLLYTAPAPAEGASGPAKADPPQLIGAYHDRYERLGEDWLIAERRGSLALTTAP